MKISVLVPTMLVLAASAPAQTPPGACLIDDEAFTTQNGGCEDLSNGVVWSQYSFVRDPVLGAATWDVADAFCASLVEGGFDDWRLPSIAEAQAAAANGAMTHLAHMYGNATWTTDRQGQWAYYVDLDTGDAVRVPWTRSYLAWFCVRGGASGGGGGGGGHGHGKRLGSGEGSRADGAADAERTGDDPPMRVMQVLSDHEWRFVLSDPARANQAFLVAARPEPVADDARTAPAPLVLLPTPLHFDAAGHARFAIPRDALPSRSPRAIPWLGVIMLDPGSAGGIDGTWTLAHPR